MEGVEGREEEGTEGERAGSNCSLTTPHDGSGLLQIEQLRPRGVSNLVANLLESLSKSPTTLQLDKLHPVQHTLLRITAAFHTASRGVSLLGAAGNWVSPTSSITDYCPRFGGQ